MPFDIPESWEWVNGFEIFNPMQSIRPEGDFFDYIDIDAIDNKRNVIITPKHLASKTAPSRATRQVSKGDVLFSMVRPYLRNIAKVDKDNYIASTGFYVCKPNDSIANDYCLYLMLSDYVVSGLNQFMKGDNSPSINNDHILSWQYPLPPIKEQQRIVASIEKLFTIIDVIETGKQELQYTIKQLKSKILDYAINGKLVSQSPNDTPAIELLRNINHNIQPCDTSHYKNIPFEIPRNWVWIKHNDIIDLVGGSQPPKSEFISQPKEGYIRLYQIRDYGETPVPVYIPLHMASKTTQKGDILLARYGGSLGKIFRAENGAYNVAMTKVVFKYNDMIFVGFAHLFYMSSLYQNKLKTISRTAQVGFNESDFDDLFFPLPPLTEQIRICKFVKTLFKSFDTIISEL